MIKGDEMEHNGKLIIVADMGELKSYKVKWISETNRYHLDLVNDMDYIEGRKTLSKMLSDERGRFGHKSGEDHGIEHEVEQRLVQRIADDISALLADAGTDSCYLAFPAKHHKELTAALSTAALNALAKNINSDLVNSPVEDILSHF